MSDDHIDRRDSTTAGAPGPENEADLPESDLPEIELPEIELVVVTMTFDASDNPSLLGVLSKYIVMARMVDGCRNVDLCSSVTTAGRHLVIQKWDSAEHQRRHFDSDLMVEMASACAGLLSNAPHIDLWEATSAHDLR